MKSLSIILLLFAVSMTFANSKANEKEPNKGSFVIHFENLKSSQGNVIVKLYDSKSLKYPDTKSAIAIKTAKIKDQKATITFDNLPYGRYAFTTFHDENSNEVMDTNMIHIPTEGYAFSNNLKIMFGPPSFEKASFELKQESLNIDVKMRY